MKLQKSPIGLLGAFALKVLGRAPDKFGDTVLPTVDVFDLYLAKSELKGVQTAAFVINIGGSIVNSPDLVVPNGKVWRVLALSTFTTLNIADTALVFSSWFMAISPTVVTIALDSRVAVGYGTGRNAGYCPSFGPLVLPAGWILRAGVGSSAAVTVATSSAFNCLVQEFDE